MKRRSSVLLLGGALLFGAVLDATLETIFQTVPLAAAQENTPLERKASAGPFAEFGGDWSSEWGTVFLLFEGNKVRGEWKDGHLEGKVDDAGNITYKWISSDAKSKGNGVFVIQKNGRIVGSWGFGSSANNGGEWTLNRP